MVALRKRQNGHDAEAELRSFIESTAEASYEFGEDGRRRDIEDKAESLGIARQAALRILDRYEEQQLAGLAAEHADQQRSAPATEAARHHASRTASRKADDLRPQIDLSAGNASGNVRRCVKLLAEDGGIFNRGGELVRLILTREARAEGIRLPGDDLGQGHIARDDRQHVITPLTADYLRVWLDQRVRFQVGDRRADCPRDLTRKVLSLGEWDGVPPLRTIARAPFMRPDGTICTTTGYDEKSSVLLFLDEEVPPVPAEPNRDDARAALKELLTPFSEMSWAEPKDEAAFIALVLTMVARSAFDTAPAFVVTATTKGSGKGLLVNCASVIANGITPAKRTYPNEEAERRKVAHAALLAGDVVLDFDNVHAGAAINSDSINAYVTADAVGDRTLGHSEARRIPNVATFCFTGNNISPAGDFSRRAIVSRLDPNCERPEQRRFKIPNLLAHVRRERPKLLCAALTMLRGFYLSKVPALDRPLLGSFEHWDRLICGCLIWLGLPDPTETQRDIHAEDPEEIQSTALYRALCDSFQSCGGHFKVADVREAILQSEARPGRRRTELQDAVDAIGGIEQLAYWLRSTKGQVHAGLKLEQVHAKPQAIWKLKRQPLIRKR